MDETVVEMTLAYLTTTDLSLQSTYIARTASYGSFAHRLSRARPVSCRYRPMDINFVEMTLAGLATTNLSL